MPNDRAYLCFSTSESLYVTVSVLDTLRDTIYSFGTELLAPGNYKAVWEYSDRQQEDLPFILWFELEVGWNPSQRSLYYFARVPFCTPESQ
jgi:hypothetical protein